MVAGVDALQSGILAGTVFLVVAGFVAVVGRYRDARLVELLAHERRRLELAADLVCELVASRDPSAFALVQLRLARALAFVASEAPECRRLLLVEPGGSVERQARLALAELADVALETEIDLDLYTLGFAWARKRRRALARRADLATMHSLAGERRAA